MLDLGMLDRAAFAIDEGPPRLALIHHGFRTTQLGLKDQRKLRFAPRFASLGLLNLARSLEHDFEAGRLKYKPEVRYFDEDCFAGDKQLAREVSNWLQPAAARFVLVGIYSLAVERTYTMLAEFDASDLCIIAGGAHPTVAPHIDYAHIVVRGEGGAALRHILTTLFPAQFGKGLDARGLCYETEEDRKVGRPAFDRSLAVLPPPAFPYELSQSRTNSEERPKVRWWMAVGASPQIYICTQSCRARCTFCSTYLIHGHAVSRPVKYIEEDLRYVLDELGHDSIEFHDDDLLQHEEFNDLLELLERLGIPWTCNARAEYVDDDLALRLGEAGCRKVFLGLESLNQESLDYYHKKTTVEMNERAVLAFDRAGIGVISGFIFGAPHDTLASSLVDLDRLLDLPVYFLSASILTPDIGTLEYQRAKRAMPELRLLSDLGSDANLRPRPEVFGAAPPFGMPTVCRELSKPQLNEIYDLACCSFFLRESAKERILSLTLPSRQGEMVSWIRWMHERAKTLQAEAEMELVRERISTVLAEFPAESSIGALRTG